MGLGDYWRLDFDCGDSVLGISKVKKGIRDLKRKPEKNLVLSGFPAAKRYAFRLKLKWGYVII